MLYLALLLILTTITQPQNIQTTDNQTIHDVIIIGAGTAGIAASKTLSEHHINHLILEARSRIGGRIGTKKLGNLSVDTGATFVHNPIHTNAINKVIN